MSKIVLVTTTWYPSMEYTRVHLVLKTIEAAHAHKYPIVVVDNSPKEVRDAIRTAGAIVYPQKQEGMGASIRQAIQEGVNLAGPDGIVIWLTPEKYTFVPLISEVCKPFEEDPDLDLVIPSRKSLKSYPAMQQLTERVGNEGFSLAMGRALDVWFGPQAFRAGVAYFYLDYTGSPDLWDSLVIPPARMIKAGKKVHEVVVNYQHPPEQLEEDTFSFYQKRIRQIATVAGALANNL